MTQLNTEVDKEHRRRLRSPSVLILWAVFLAACIGTALIGRFYFDAQRKDIVNSKATELSAVRDLKIQQILDWRTGRLTDGRALANDPAFRDEINRWVANPDDPAVVATLREWMKVMEKQRGYSGVAIMSPDGSRWLSSTGEAPSDPVERTEAENARGSTETTLTDLFLDPVTKNPRLDVVAPLSGGSAKTQAVVILNRDPRPDLFPLIQQWPTPSPSSETLLVRRENDTVLYLNELRFKSNTALVATLPVSNSELLAVQALSGAPRATEGSDYRKSPVFGAVGQVGNTPWYIVAKVDQSEAFAGVRQSQLWITTAVLAVLAFVGLGLAFAWRRRTAEYYRLELEAERSQAQLTEQYGLLTRYANDAVILTDETLHIMEANERAVALYGYSEDELLVMTLDDLLEPDDDEHTPSLADTLRGASGLLLEIRQHRADGSVIDTEMSAQAIVSDGQTLYLTITRDMTDRKQAQEELLARTEDLARSNAELEKFAYIASHDLQEPLRMVASYTQLLQRRYQGRLDQDADEFIAFAVDGATRMQTLINELLAYSRVGTQGAPFAEADLDAVLSRVLKALEVSIGESGAEITHDPMPIVTCDATQVGQIFQNLITNAIKFHGVDPPQIHIGVERVGAERVFSVHDNGLGVEPEYFDRIFVIFQRLQSRAEYPGTGMGLAICKRIIERHSGRIWVESELGRGSTFYFTLGDQGTSARRGQSR